MSLGWVLLDDEDWQAIKAAGDQMAEAIEGEWTPSCHPYQVAELWFQLTENFASPGPG